MRYHYIWFLVFNFLIGTSRLFASVCGPKDWCYPPYSIAKFGLLKQRHRSLLIGERMDGINKSCLMNPGGHEERLRTCSSSKKPYSFQQGSVRHTTCYKRDVFSQTPHLHNNDYTQDTPSSYSHCIDWGSWNIGQSCRYHTTYLQGRVCQWSLPCIPSCFFLALAQLVVVWLSHLVHLSPSH